MKISIIKNLFSIFVLFFILFGSFFHYILNNQNEIKSYLLSYLQKNLNTEFSYESEELEFFPFLGIKLNNLKVLSDSGSVKAEVSKLHLNVSWLEFFQKNIQIESLRISSGYLNYTLEKKNRVQKKPNFLKIFLSKSLLVLDKSK